MQISSLVNPTNVEEEKISFRQTLSENEGLPSSFYEANITKILKPEKGTMRKVQNDLSPEHRDNNSYQILTDQI